jgi:hypothetical protein
MFGGVQINGQDSNNIYKRAGDLTIASPSIHNIILKTNNGTWEKAMEANRIKGKRGRDEPSLCCGR